MNLNEDYWTSEFFAEYKSKDMLFYDYFIKDYGNIVL